jgi:hypothetical protein
MFGYHIRNAIYGSLLGNKLDEVIGQNGKRKKDETARDT